jgi:hypothetical protein
MQLTSETAKRKGKRERRPAINGTSIFRLFGLVEMNVDVFNVYGLLRSSYVALIFFC